MPMKSLARFVVVPFLLAACAAHAEGLPTSLAALASKVAPAIVSVTALSPLSHNDGPPGGEDENGSPQLQSTALKKNHPGVMVPPPNSLESLGSGFIFNAAGYILTNNHVIAGATDITVTLADGSVYPAIVAGRDPQADLAVLKIDAHHKLPYLAFGNSTKMKVGDWVLAVGNPYGMPNTNTFGIISALHRQIGLTAFDDYIQTDAAINRGNSGGPLLDMHGQVVGVDSAIYAPTGVSDGIGFAIPASMAQPVAEALMTNGKMTRGWLGVSTELLTPAIQTVLNLPNTDGALIGAVAQNGPSAGKLQPGDDIIALGGDKIANPQALYIHVAEIQAGQSVQLAYIRAGDTHHLTLTVTVPPSAEVERLATQTEFPNPVMLPAYGLGLVATPTGEGVEVSSATGPAAAAGVKAGDVILQLDGQPVTNAQDLRHFIDRLGQDPAVLLITGKGAPHWVVVTKQHAAAPQKT